MANLEEANVDEAIDRAIDQYWKKGMLVDAIFWSKAIGILRDRIKNLREGEKNEYSRTKQEDWVGIRW